MIEIFQEDDEFIAFFPKSLRSFKINKDMKILIELIQSGEPTYNICEFLDISQEDLSQLIFDLKQINLPPDFDKRREIPDNVLKRLSINISNDCNLKCTYCYANFGCYGAANNLMDLELIKVTLDKFFEAFDEILIIQVFGGEPLLHYEGFKFICEYIETKYTQGKIKYRTQITTVTNGTIMTSKIIELIKKYHVLVTISLDGPEEIHDKSRPFLNGQGTFSKILKNIEKLNAVTNQPAQIEVTYNQEHINRNVSILDILKFIEEKLKHISVHIAPVSADKKECFALENRNAFVESVDEINRHNSSTNSNLGYVILEDIQESLKYPHTRINFCDAGIDLISVSTTGEVYPCYMFIDEPEFYLMDIKDPLFSRETLLMKTKSYRNYNRLNDLNSKCSTCFAANVCGGCMGINYYNTNDIHISPSDDCTMKRKMLKKVVFNLQKSNGSVNYG